MELTNNMTNVQLPSLRLLDWQESRDTIHQYARLLGKIRTVLMPPQKHWWHITLYATAMGLTTTPILVKDKTVELLLNFVHHSLLIMTSHGEKMEIPLPTQSIASLHHTVINALSIMNIKPELDHNLFVDEVPRKYDSEAVTRYWRTLAWIDGVFKHFKGELREETSPVQIFPHHFDLSMNWFSGRLVPGVDPSDEESADEQMNFGFVSGDSYIPDAYFYITAYPLPEGLTDTVLPKDAYWHTEGFTGAIMMYEFLQAADDPKTMLLTLLRTVHQASAKLMQ
jgi:hypothetical protein